MKRYIIISILGLVLSASSIVCKAQNYESTPVTVSEKTVEIDGRKYYSHSVLERQTLYSISKAYGVSLDDIYKANPDLDLKKDGIKKDQIINIPVQNVSTSAQQVTPQKEKSQFEWTEHQVKWYEDIKSIAKKYGLSVQELVDFNNLKSPSVSKQQILRIPTKATLELIRNNANIEEEPQQEETEEEPIDTEEEFVSGNSVSASLILPFNASKTASDNHLDFYSGVLLAVHDLEKSGMNVDLSVFDCGDGTIPVTSARLEKSDVVIGPVSKTDLEKALSICPPNTAIVSPLEPKAAELLSDNHNLIQAPTSAETLSINLIDWIETEFKDGDKLILVTEKNGVMSTNAQNIVNCLEASVLAYSKFSYAVLEGADILETLEAQVSTEGRTHFILASENEAFANDFIRNLNLLVHLKYDLALYCTSKIRSFETIEVENLHNVRMHAVLTYYIDYDSKDVQNFLMEYRALFNTEPGPFAFQGYDLAKMFLSLGARYGSHWIDYLNGYKERGLQSDFEFRAPEDSGYMNNASRRISYGPDFSIKLERR